MLQAVSPLAEEALQQLIDAELIYRRGLQSQASYLFKHALVQDTAFQSMLKSRRQALHHQVAQVLEQESGETVEAQPELVAHHYTEAGRIAQAIPYWQQAGQRANRRAANVEAITYLTKGIELLQTLPDTPERAQQELPFQTALGGPLIALKGFASPDVGAVYPGAWELCRHIGETPQICPVLWGLVAFYSVRAEWKTARELAGQLLSIAQSAQDTALLIEAHYAVGQAQSITGEFAAGRAHYEQRLTLYDPEQYHALAFVYGLDPGVMAGAMLASTLLSLGYHDQARKMSADTLALADELSHPNSLAFALNCAAWLCLRCRDEQSAHEQAEALITLSTEQGYATYLTMGTLQRGHALVAQGYRAEGIALMLPALNAYQATGSEVGRPRFLTLLAQAYGQEGQLEKGMTLLAEAHALIERTGERDFAAEFYRIKGELLLQPHSSRVQSEAQHEAETYFQRALAVAQQHAKLWELRAATSLARLWQQQDKTQEARDLLAPVYNWFTEGFDTQDLKDAKSLLEDLS